MKKRIAILLCVTAMLSLASCGAPQTSEPISTQPENQETVAPSSAQQEQTVPVLTETTVIGRWEYVCTVPGNIRVTQILEIGEDGTATYLVIEEDANGVVQEQDPMTYQWKIENGELILVRKQNNTYYLYDGEKDTLTDKHQRGNVFKRVN